MDFFENLERHQPIFTKKQKNIYSKIIDKSELIERSTVKQLADFLAITPSSLMRFCQKAGYSGYSEFRYDYIRSAHDTRKFDNESILTISDSILNIVDLLTDELRNTPENYYKNLANTINNSTDIFCVGLGKSAIPGIIMEYTFSRFGKKISVINDVIMIRDLSKFVSKNSVVIFFTSEYSLKDVKLEINSVSKITKNTYIISNMFTDNLLNDKKNNIILPSVSTSGRIIDNQMSMILFVEILLAYYVSEFI